MGVRIKLEFRREFRQRCVGAPNGAHHQNSRAGWTRKMLIRSGHSVGCASSTAAGGRVRCNSGGDDEQGL